jgi:hypothetical protein
LKEHNTKNPTKLLLILPIIISVFSLCVSIFVAWRGCEQDKRITEISYRTNRPRLEPVGEFQLDSIAFGFLPNKIINIHRDTMTRDSIPVVDVNWTIAGHLTFCNMGTDIARIRFYAYLDKNSTDAIIRDVLLGKKIRNISFSMDSLSNALYFKIVDIAPRDTFKFSIVRQIQFITETEDAVLHFLVLYENQSGAFFDTYYWTRLKISGCNMMFAADSQYIFLTPVSEEELLNSIKIIQSRPSYNMYSDAQKNKMMASIKKF